MTSFGILEAGLPVLMYDFGVGGGDIDSFGDLTQSLF